MIEKWEDMTVDDFEKVCRIMEEVDNIYDRQVELIAVLDRRSIEDVLDMPLADFKQRALRLDFLDDEPEKKVPPTTMLLNGNEYRVEYNAEKMTTAQFIDFQAYSKKGNDYVGLASVVVIPYDKKYGEYDMAEVHEDIRSMSIQNLISICFFFRLRLEGLLKASGDYVEKKLKKAMKKAKGADKMKIGREIVKMRNLMSTLI